MNLKVFTGPDPVANLTELFRRTPLRSGTICAVVPDYYSVTVMERNLAKSLGDAFCGHKIFTIEGLSKAVISLEGFVPETIGSHVKRALLAEIVKSRIGNRSRFYNISHFPGFINLLVSFLEEFRSGENIDTSLDPDIASVMRAYESHLNRLGLTDHEGAVKMALESDLLERFADSVTGSLIVDGFYDLTEYQLELFSRLFKRFGRSTVTVVNDPSRESLFSLPLKLIEAYRTIGAKIVEIPSVASTGPARVLSGFTRGEYDKSSGYHDVEIHTFQSTVSEADWIAGTIRSMLVSCEYRAEDIMLVSRDEPGFGSPLYNALKRHGIPVEGGVFRPILSHPLVKLALNALDASIDPREEHIQKVRNSCFTGSNSYREFLTLKNTDDRAWSCIITEADSPEGYVSSMKKMFDWLLVKKNLSGGGKPDIAIQERNVYEKLIALLDEFANFYCTFRPMMKAGEFSRLLRLFLSGISIRELGSPGRGVMVLGADHARYVRRKVLFFNGLDNASFPKSNDCFSLHDPETAKKILQNKDLEEPLLFYMSISGSELLFLTFPGIDDEGKDDSISPYLEEIQEGIKSVSPVHNHKGVPGAAWEDGYVTERGKLENMIRILGDPEFSAVNLLSNLRGRKISVSEKVEHALESHIKLVEVQDMNLTDDDAKKILEQRWGNEHIFAVTDLEQYISCPVKFYFARILGLEPERYYSDMLDPAERGSIIHEILAGFYTTRQQKHGKTVFLKAEITENKMLMEEIINDVFNSRAELNNQLHPIIINAEKRFIHRWMNYFVVLEAKVFENTYYVPEKFEVAFGNDSCGPLEITVDGENVKVRGRIDRIDIARCDSGECASIIDYKTGQNPSLSEVKKGTSIQLPLYIKAASELILPGVLIDYGMYYNLKNANYDLKKKMLTGCTVIEQEIGTIIDTACSQAVQSAVSIREALFPEPEKCSDHCDWRFMCRGRRSKHGEVLDAAE